MRETLEIATASRMQNMVHIGKEKHLLRDQNVFRLFLILFPFRALDVESPRGGAIRSSYDAVKAARRLVIPSGIGISVREWLTRRLGGEVDVWYDGRQTTNPNEESAIGLIGQIDMTTGAWMLSTKRQRVAM